MKSEIKSDRKQWASIGILIFMLIIEFGQTGLATILFGADDVSIFIFYSTEIYLLTCIAIGLERENLTNLNVDPLFIVLLLSSGIITSAITPYPYNIASGFGLFLILWLFLGSGMVFNPKPALPWVKILTLIALPPIIALLPTIFRLLFFRGSLPNTDDLFYFFL
jgi:hypothetical protein